MEKSMLRSLLNLLKEPEIKKLNVDDPSTVEIHKQMIQKKPLLLDVYSSYYNKFVNVSKRVPSGLQVEIGSGGGFLKKYLPDVITSDILDLPHIDKVFSAENIELEDSTVSAFFLLDVFHHIKNPRQFFNEIQRCLIPDGRLVMIEPANTFWGRFIRKNFHHEPHDERAGWEMNGSNPMSDANLALPWIVFFRDKNLFEQEFPNLSIVRCKNHTPLRFLLSGGITYRSIIPAFMTPIVKIAEYLLSPFNGFLGMHVTIEIKKILSEKSISRADKRE